MKRLANGFPVLTSTSVMKTAVAFMMAFMLLSIVAICPIMACPMTAGSDGGGESRTTVRDCPYFVLENGKTPNTASPIFNFIFHPTLTDSAVSSHSSILPAESRLPNSAGLFLRICMLRV
jgi:hypothetical protein